VNRIRRAMLHDWLELCHVTFRRIGCLRTRRLHVTTNRTSFIIATAVSELNDYGALLSRH